jgi:hypothetical protein
MAAASARIASAVVALAIVAATWFAGDGGGARAAIGQATGPLVATAPGDAAVLVAEGLAPGVARTGEVTVTNVGDAAGAFALSAGDLADSVAPLSEVLELAVDDVTPGRPTAPVFAGHLDALTGVALGTLAQGEARRYRFTVRFPSGRPDDVDDAYQGASTSVTFVWAARAGEATSPATASSQGVPSSDTRTPAISVASTAAGPGRARRATLTVRARQTGAGGFVVAWARCRTSCRLSVGGTASAGSTTARLRTVRRTLPRAGRVRVSLALPRAARAALAAGRPVTVALRLAATMGPRVVVVRRTVHVVARSR